MLSINEIKELALHTVRGTVPATYANQQVSMNEAFADALKDLAGSYTQFMKNRYDIYDIMIVAADEIVPKKVVDVVAPFSEVQIVGQGQKALFKRKLGRNRAKKFLTRVGLSGVYETFRLDTDTFEVPAYAIGGGVRVDFERMLDGQESLQEVMAIMTEALADSIYVEIQKALRGAINAIGRPDKNKVSLNTFDATEMVKMVNVVKAYGQSAAIFATPEFIAEMGPDAIVPGGTGYVGVYSPQDIEDIHNYGFIKMFRGTPVIEIPQSFVDENNEQTWIDPQLAYILPTGGEKVVKVVLEGGTQMYDWQNKDQSMEIHFYRKMGVAILAHHNWAIYQNTGIEQTYYNPYENL